MYIQPDLKTQEILAKFPKCIRAAYDPEDPLHVLIRYAWGAGLYNFDYELTRELDGRWPHRSCLTTPREVYKSSHTSPWNNPSAEGRVGVSWYPVTKTADEEQFWYGLPTRLAFEMYIHISNVEDAVGLAYVRERADQDGILYYVLGSSTTPPGSGTLEGIYLSAPNDQPTFGEALPSADFLYKTQSYDETGVDIILKPEPTEHIPEAPDRFPHTDYTAALPHKFVTNVKVYDILNLDAHGNATEVPQTTTYNGVIKTQWTVDSEAGIITFLKADDGRWDWREAVRIGAEDPSPEKQKMDPGWNSTYIAEYRYRNYSDVRGLTSIRYLQDWGSDKELIGGMMPNTTRYRLIASVNFSESPDPAYKNFQVARSDLYEDIPVRCLWVYSNVISATYYGTDLTINDDSAASSTELPEDIQNYLKYTNQPINRKVSFILDGVEYELPENEYTVSCTWGSGITTIHIDSERVISGTQLKFYYVGAVLWSVTSERGSGHNADYELVTDASGRTAVEYNTVIRLPLARLTPEQASIINDSPIQDFSFFTEREKRLGVAADPARSIVWTIEGRQLVGYNSDGFEVAHYNLFDMESLSIASGVDHPILSGTVPHNFLGFHGLTFWRRWLLTIGKFVIGEEPRRYYDYYLGIIDPNKPQNGIMKWIPQRLLRNVTPYDLTIGPADRLYVSTTGGNIYQFCLYYDYFMVNYNELICRHSYDKLRVSDSELSTTTIVPQVAVPVATNIDNMLTLMTMSRLPGYRNEDDVRRASLRLFYKTNSSREGLINALTTEFVTDNAGPAFNRVVYILKYTPLGYDPNAQVHTGIADPYFPITVTYKGSGLSVGRQGVNSLDHIPANAVPIYDKYGNMQRTWRWCVWFNETYNYTPYLEFLNAPPSEAIKVTYWIKGEDGVPIKFSEFFHPKGEYGLETQPLEIATKMDPVHFEIFGVWGLNNLDDMRRLGYFDLNNRPTKKLHSLIEKQDRLLKLKWSTGYWDYTPWSDERTQLSGAEYIPARFDHPYIPTDGPKPK